MYVFFILALIQELMVENSDLRESLKSMQTELVNLLNHHNDDYENENNTEVSNVSHNFVFCCNPYFVINVWFLRISIPSRKGYFFFRPPP